MKAVFGVILASFLSACVSLTEPVALDDKGTYLITLNAHGGFHNDGELLNESIEKAKEFCFQRGMNADIKNTQSSGTQLWTPQNNQVTFTCVPKS